MADGDRLESVSGIYSNSVDRFISIGNVAVGRGASYIIAANDSPDYAKAQADIVCNGTDDQDTINTAMDSYKDVYLQEGIFKDTDNIDMKRANTRLRGAGPSTIIELQAADDVAIEFDHTSERNIVSDMTIKVAASQTASLIKASISSTSGAGFRDNIMERIWVDNETIGNNGFDILEIDGSADKFGLGNEFRYFKCGYCDRMINFNISHASFWFNGNKFDNWWAEGYKTAMIDFNYTNGIAPNGTNRNTFSDIQSQTQTYSVDAFKNVKGTGNVFIGCHPWDFTTASSPNKIWSMESDAVGTIIISKDSTSLILTNIDDGGSLTRFIGGQVNIMPMESKALSNPPTKAEIDGIMGLASVFPKGVYEFWADNNTDNVYIILGDGTKWYYFTGTEAT